MKKKLTREEDAKLKLSEEQLKLIEQRKAKGKTGGFFNVNGKTVFVSFYKIPS